VQNADIAALYDSLRDARILNAGFIIIRPSPLGQQLYRTIRAITRSAEIDDQKALNRAIGMMKRRRKRDEEVLRVNVLDRNQFLSGLDYFEKSGRKFPKVFGGCKPQNTSKCPLVVHNNWIVSKEAKVYRFREHLMWLYDGNDQYYSSETRKYLMYTNPKPTTSSGLPRNVTERELSALRTALAIGYVLDRVVILPRFHFRDRECPLNSIVHIKTFDARFAGRYRENSFLQHPKVPDLVTQDVTDRQFFVHANQSFDVHVSRAEIMRLLGEVNAKVLNLGNLQRVKVELEDRSIDRVFSSELQNAFRRARYRQIH